MLQCQRFRCPKPAPSCHSSSTVCGAARKITITRHGEPVAVLLRPDALRARRDGAGTATAARIRDLLDGARLAPLPAAAAISPERADELITAIRADRAAR